MPGFTIGGSPSNQQKSNVAETRRKHRWVFSKLGDLLGPRELVYLQKAQRPQFKFNEVVMHHDQEEAYFAGKQQWEPINFSWYDVEQNPDVSARLWAWLGVVNPTLASLNETTCVNAPNVYKKQAQLEMTGNCDGIGNPTERWVFYGLWPREMNWQELDYEANEILRIDVVGRYDKARRI